MIRRRLYRFSIVGLSQEPLHVRLARHEPNLAHENVFKFDLVLARNSHYLGLKTGSEFTKIDTPLPVRSGNHGFFLT